MINLRINRPAKIGFSGVLHQDITFQTSCMLIEFKLILEFHQWTRWGDDSIPGLLWWFTFVDITLCKILQLYLQDTVSVNSITIHIEGCHWRLLLCPIYSTIQRKKSVIDFSGICCQIVFQFFFRESGAKYN